MDMPPHGIPIFISAPERPAVRQVRDEAVPKRVAFAFNCIQFFSDKTESVIAGGGDVTAPQEFDGQELDVEEKELFRASCRLLTSYVTGEYELSDEEAERKAERKGRKKRRSSKTGIYRVAACPACQGTRRVDGNKCSLCMGTGHVSLTAVRADGSPL